MKGQKNLKLSTEAVQPGACFSRLLDPIVCMHITGDIIQRNGLHQSRTIKCLFAKGVTLTVEADDSEGQRETR